MKRTENIFQNEHYWKEFNEKELNLYADKILSYYRKSGFPFYKTDNSYRSNEFLKLFKYDCSTIIINKLVKQTMHGLALAWSYMPHSFYVSCNNMKTPMEVYEDDELFLKAIKKRLKIGTYITDSGIRKALKVYSGVQTVSNFRPTSATAIYERYSGEGSVLDMSCGYGGRLLGAIKSKRVTRYTGLEPCSETYSGLLSLAENFNNRKEDMFLRPKKIQIYKMGSEDFVEENKYDLCFTSPPYFNLEKYSKEETQSYIKYPTVDSWYDGFLKKTIQNSHLNLKKNGKLILNIKNTKTLPDFVEKTKEYALDCGFVLSDFLYLELSQQTFMKEKQNHEPILVLEKLI
mgnify:CR=1 FL=1|tara:strand:+ start:172 stop:1209 length:1038 start_codon:yes stop_codon:yes gene_type:complete